MRAGEPRESLPILRLSQLLGGILELSALFQERGGLAAELGPPLRIDLLAPTSEEELAEEAMILVRRLRFGAEVGEVSPAGELSEHAPCPRIAGQRFRLARGQLGQQRRLDQDAPRSRI